MMTSAYLLSRTDWYKYSPEDEFTLCNGAQCTFQCRMPWHASCNAKLSATISTGTASAAP
eukprot:6043101-Lingulodinium_polyedra.AAC.1